jgi:hypothetical protein
MRLFTNIILGLNSLPEPCFLVYDVSTPELDQILAALKFGDDEQRLIQKCADNQIARTRRMSESSDELVSWLTLLF